MRAIVVFCALLVAGSYANDAEWAISYLDSEVFTAKLNDELEAKITLVGARENIGCRVRTPSGVDYDLEEGDEVPGVQKLEGPLISCGIIVNVLSEEQIGDWMLIANETNFDFPAGERRLNFTIQVEERVNTIPRDAALLVEGNDFYIRLEQPISNPESCHIEGPGQDRLAAGRVEIDEQFVANCGYIVRNVEADDSGTWEIVYGDKVVYRAAVDLTVTAGSSDAASKASDLTLIRDKPANETLGASNAIYCVLEDPSGITIYEHFGQCQLVLDRVTIEHAGTWTMKVNLPGRVTMDTSTFTVTVQSAEPKPTVTATVVKNNPTVDLHCRVSTPHTIKSCKFRDPAGNILIASIGVGEGRYSFIGDGVVSATSEVTTYDCGLRLDGVVVSDLGLWRCAIETDVENYYGFMTLIQRFIEDPAVAAIVKKEPSLTADVSSVSALAGEPITLGCSVEAAISYCYFRSRSGSVFSVGPATSGANYEYAGAGFDAGECSIRFHSLSANEGIGFHDDSGPWSCHVGFLDASEEEQRASIDVTVQQPITVKQTTQGSDLVVEGVVYDRRPVDYCRFVRMDGLGFTTSNLPEHYVSTSNLNNGLCSMRIHSASILEHHPWTVVARVSGHDEEITGTTLHTIEMPPSTGPVESETDDSVVIHFSRNDTTLLLSMMLIVVPLIIVGLLMTCRKSREWTFTRASRVRDSFRSMNKNVVIINDGLPKKEGLPAYSA